MKKLPFWFKGGLLGVSYALVIFFIKGICSGEWCFADIFFPSLFFPLVVFDYILPAKYIAAVGENIFITVFVVWFLIGAIAGTIFQYLKLNKE